MTFVTPPEEERQSTLEEQLAELMEAPESELEELPVHGITAAAPPIGILKF